MIVGNYELLTRLAHGGMAEAHVARSLIDGSIAVVKQLLPKYIGDSEFIEMFLDEGRVISSLQHPNVVAMKEFGFHNQLPYLAMEYLHGVNLRTLARTHSLRGKQFPLEVAFFVVEAMLDGLHHAHEARSIDGRPMDITHRDVSPHNVVVTFDGQVKLIDFGIAKARGKSNETRSGALKGKVPYMAPEQVRSTVVDRRTDVYAAGVVLYELVVGRRPYVGNTPKLNEFNLMMAIANHQLVTPRTIHPSIPPALDHAIMRALAAAPERRYQTAQEMRSALQTVGQELGVAGTSQHLSELMITTLGRRKPYAEALKSDAEVIELVAELERTKTIIDERSDPNLIDPNPAASDKQRTAGPNLGSALPNEAANEPDSQSIKAVDKIVDANRTRLTFQRPIDKGFRWGKLLDGLEGVVEIQFADAELTGTALSAAVDALRNIGSEVKELHLVGAPIKLAAELGDRATIESVAVRGRCAACRMLQTVTFSSDELKQLRGNSKGVQCPRCATKLVDVDLSELEKSLPPSGLRLMVPTPQHEHGPRKRRGVAFYVGGLVVCALAGGVLWSAKKPQPPHAASELSSARVRKDSDHWIVELDRADSESSPKVRAMRAVISELEAMLPLKLRPWSGTASDAEAVANLQAQLSDVVELELQSKTGVRDNEYTLSTSAIAQALEHYSQVKSVWGLELANAPPTRGTGVLVISAPTSGPIAAGDRVVSVEGRVVRSVQALSEHRLTQSQLELVVEHREQRTMYVRNSRE